MHKQVPKGMCKRMNRRVYNGIHCAPGCRVPTPMQGNTNDACEMLISNNRTVVNADQHGVGGPALQ